MKPLLIQFVQLLLCCVAGTAASAADDLVRVHELAAGNKTRGDAVALCAGIISDSARPEAERQRARRVLPDVLLEAGRAAEARTAADTLAQSDAHAAGLGEVLAAAILAKDGKRAEALTALRKLAAAGEALVKARANYRLAVLLASDEKGKPGPANLQEEAFTAAESAIVDIDDPWLARQSLQLAQQVAERLKDGARLERVLRRSLEEPVLSLLLPRERDTLSAKLGQAIEKAGRFPEARALYEAQLAHGEADALPRWRLAIARTWKGEGKPEQALARCEEVFTSAGDPGPGVWQEAQRLVVECLAADPTRAAAAARTWYEADGSADAAKALAQLLVAGDAKRARGATDWLAYGRLGPDGQSGTADDLAPPTAALPQRATYPARAAAAQAIALSGPVQARRRATLLLWAGQPAAAAQVARWWLGQAQGPADLAAAADTLARCALALSGDPAARRAELRYLADGPAGEDGKAGTADDVVEQLPVGAALTAAPPAAEDAALLRRLRPVAVGIIVDPRAEQRLRASMVGAVQRIDCLLGERAAAAELLDWCTAGERGGQQPAIFDALVALRVGQDGHLAGLGEVERQIAGGGGEQLPANLAKGQKAWEDLRAALRTGVLRRQ